MKQKIQIIVQKEKLKSKINFQFKKEKETGGCKNQKMNMYYCFSCSQFIFSVNKCLINTLIN